MRTNSYVLCFLIIAMLISGCGMRKSTDSAIVATVNGQPIYAKELQRELSMRCAQNPSLEVNDKTLNTLADSLIDRQVIIQEAMKKNMTQEEDFVETIKLFWEQTLIRNFIMYKNRQLDKYIFVTDKEIKDYYDKLKEQGVDVPSVEEASGLLKDRIAQAKKMQAFEKWLGEEKKKSEVIVNKKVISELVKK